MDHFSGFLEFNWAMDGYGQATEQFSAWLSEVAGVRMSPKIAISDLRNFNQGRCVVAREAIEGQEVLFEIPRSAILNVGTSRLTEKYPGIRGRLLEEIGHWEGLVLCMLYEMKVLNIQSRWWAYFQVLPRPDEVNSLMFWNDEQLEGLKPSLIVERVGVAEAKQMYERVLQYVEESGVEELGSVSWSDFVYVASVIMSYSFDVELVDADPNEEQELSTVKNDGYMKSMIPLADTLNANTSKCNANLVYDIESLKMCATKPIGMGEQVYNIYGDHPNSELLRRYGYVEWEGSKYDFGEVPMATLVNVIHQKFQWDIEHLTQLIDIIRDNETIGDELQGENIVLHAYDCYSDGQIIPECVVLLQIMVTFLQISEARTLDRPAVERTLLRVVKKCFQLVESGRITKNCARMIEYVIDARLREYPSHVFREITPDHYSIPDIESLRQRMTEKVLQSEVDSLQNCFQSVEENFKLIADSKLLENISKRKLPVKKFKTMKKVKR